MIYMTNISLHCGYLPYCGLKLWTYCKDDLRSCLSGTYLIFFTFGWHCYVLPAHFVWYNSNFTLQTSLVQIFLLGAVAKLGATVVTYPLLVVKVIKWWIGNDCSCQLAWVLFPNWAMFSPTGKTSGEAKDWWWQEASLQRYIYFIPTIFYDSFLPFVYTFASSGNQVIFLAVTDLILKILVQISCY